MAKRNNDIVVEVMGGPNKWDLVFESFINGKEVEFSICFPAEYSSRRVIIPYKFKVLGLHEMKKPDNWIVYGIFTDPFGCLIDNIKAGFRNCDFSVLIPSDSDIYFTGTYDAQHRTGEIRIILPDTDVSNKETVILPDYLSNALQS